MSLTIASLAGVYLDAYRLLRSLDRTSLLPDATDTMTYLPPDSGH